MVMTLTSGLAGQKPISITTRIKTFGACVPCWSVPGQKPISITTRIKTFKGFKGLEHFLKCQKPISITTRIKTFRLNIYRPICRRQKPISITTRIKTFRSSWASCFKSQTVRNPYPLQQGLRPLFRFFKPGFPGSETHIHYNKD